MHSAKNQASSSVHARVPSQKLAAPMPLDLASLKHVAGAGGPVGSWGTKQTASSQGPVGSW